MEKYKMNFSTKTLTITRAFATKATKPNSEEANLILNMRALVPDLKIAYKTHKVEKPHPFKGLSYDKMKEYIRYCQNSNELMATYNRVKDISKSQNNPHNYVCRWFLAQFPDFREIPTLVNGEIVTVSPILPMEENEALKKVA